MEGLEGQLAKQAEETSQRLKAAEARLGDTEARVAAMDNKIGSLASSKTEEAETLGKKPKPQQLDKLALKVSPAVSPPSPPACSRPQGGHERWQRGGQCFLNVRRAAGIGMARLTGAAPELPGQRPCERDACSGGRAHKDQQPPRQA